MRVKSISEGEHSAIVLTFIKLPFVSKIFVLSIIEWPFYTGFTVHANSMQIFRQLLKHLDPELQCLLKVKEDLS